MNLIEFLPIYGLLLFGLSCNGHELFFQQSKLKILIPLVNHSKLILDKNPLIKFKLVDLTNTGRNYNYQLENQVDYLKIDAAKGELWFNRVALNQGNYSNLKEIIISANKTSGNEARVTLDLQLQKVESLDEFCRENVCFWESITYHVLESISYVFKPQEVGDFAPKIYKKLCSKYFVNYKLINGTNYLNAKNGKLLTNAPINYEQHNPGPRLNVKVSCQIKSTNFTKTVEKVLEILIIDLNDNPIQLQDNHQLIDVHLDTPFFSKDNLLHDQTFVVFADDDSAEANNGISFELLNDHYKYFKEQCTKVDARHGTSSTIFYCSLRFITSGEFQESPYCVTIQALEELKGNDHTQNATICVHIDTIKAHKIETLPAPAKLRQNTGDNSKKTKNYVSNVLEPFGGGSSSSHIEYPKFVELLHSASSWTRVAEPIKTLDPKLDLKFKVSLNPLNAFGITPKGGILFLKDAELLVDALPAIYRLNISWIGNESREIKVSLIAAEQPSCSNNVTLEQENFCAIFKRKEECESSCGVGSQDGKCKWRQGPKYLSTKYSTCTPDLKTCSDDKCDPLELQAFNSEKYICPQDCVKKNDIVNSIFTGNRGIGSQSSPMVCSCDEHERCICGVPPLLTTSTTSTTTMSSNVVAPTNTTELFELPKQKYPSVAAKECGFLCFALVLGCPMFLVVILVTVVLMRRRYVKKMKKRMMENGGPIITFGRRSNDTEIINFEMPQMQEMNQKLDFDSKWEYDRTQLILDVVLGEGEFGKVLKGFASDINGNPGVTTVAVKTLKTGANSVELLALLSECQLLQEVSHPNVIKLLGACTKGDQPLLIIEYCCHGSLRNYLRLSRKMGDSGAEYVNGMDEMTVQDVISFAWQICKGMAYLADMKLVHRDLAARNVLVADGKVCKISDFGLTRDVYEDDAYLKKSKDRVPVKWMAPESLADHFYTSKSDVWSFGVVGWELITLAASPYPGVPPQNLYHLLRSGYRMERPENCSSEIYSILESCWADDPKERPSFKLLAQKWERLLGKSAKYLEIEDFGDAISNPIYLANIDQDQSSIKEYNGSCDLLTVLKEENQRLDQLWCPPKYKDLYSDPKKYLLKYDSPRPTSTASSILNKYDVPRSLLETKTVDQKMRYENDLVPLLRKNGGSQPNLHQMTADERQELSKHYDTPALKRIRSYLEMDFLQQTKHKRLIAEQSFEDNNNNELARNSIECANRNLNLNNLDEKHLTDKHISFKFSSLNDLNQQLTTTTV